MSFWNSIIFQNLVSNMNSQLEALHDLILVWLLVIISVVLIIGVLTLSKNSVTSLSLDSLILEVTWTIIPIFILISIAMPSITLLCQQDCYKTMPFTSVKLLANQWNWQSEQSEEMEHLLDSEKIDELSNYENPLILPEGMLSRFLITSTDVLHSLGVPSLGIKLDATPGRLNAVLFSINSVGVLTGSCYELCGSGHSAMPIFFFSN